MKVQKQHLQIALFVLAAVVLYSVWSFMGSAPRPDARRPQADEPLLRAAGQPGAPGGAAAVDPRTIPAPPEVDTVTSPSWERDAFLFGAESRDVQAATAEHVLSTDPVVRSILYSKDRRVALVGSRMVAVGDQVGVWKVLEIERDAVVFTASDGARRRVSLYGASRSGLTR